MILPGLSIAAFVFAATLILSFRPDRMGRVRKYRSPLSQLRWAVSICQDAAFGRPVLTLRPNRRKVTMRLDFVDEARVFVRVPLILKKQLADQDRLKALLETYGADVVASAPNGQTVFLTAVLDRTDTGLWTRVEQLYASMFGIGAQDVTNIEVETLAVDGSRLETLYKGFGKPTNEELIKSLSHRHAGKTVGAILRGRLLSAADIFLYPPLGLASYALSGVVGMALAIISVVAFHVLNALSENKAEYAPHRWIVSLVVAMLAAATWATGKVVYLRYLPMVMGAGLCWAVAAQHGNKQGEADRSKSKLPTRHGVDLDYWLHVFTLFVGLGVILAGYWARSYLQLDAWVRFYAFLRLELFVAMMSLLLPLVLVVTSILRDESENPEP